MKDPDDANCLRAAAYLLDKGFPPRALMKELGLDPSALQKYDPEQPRVPAGHGRESGRWTEDASGTASDQINVSARRYAPKIVQIAADGPLVPRGLNVIPQIAPDPLDPKG